MTYLKVFTTLCVFLIVGVSTSFGQSWSLCIKHFGWKKDSIVLSNIDSVSIKPSIDAHIERYYRSFGLVGIIDTLYFEDKKAVAHIFLTKELTKEKLEYNEDAKIALSSYKIPPILDSVILQRLLAQVTDYYTIRGYPFAFSRLDSISIDGQNKISARISLTKGDRFVFDSISNRGNLKIHPTVFLQLVGLKSGDAYNHLMVKRIKTRLANLPYVLSRRDYEIRFVNGLSNVYTYLDQQKASRFDLLIGVLPQESPQGRKYKVTGDVLIEMHNALQYGEYIFGQYKGLQNGTTEFLFKSSLPYISKLPIGAHMDFRLFRNSDKHIDVYFDGGGQFLFGSSNNNFKLLYNNRTSRLITIDTAEIKRLEKLPSRLDSKYTGLGMSLEIRNVDFRPNPYQGLIFLSSASLGSRKILKNATISGLEGFSNVYDTLSSATFQAEVLASIQYFQKVKDYGSIKLAFHSGLKYNRQGVILNEFYRIGGSRTLRGFDEESILTDAYGYLTGEFRIVFNQYSYMSLPFIDFGYTHVDLGDRLVWDRVLGVGLGINFATKAGIFNTSLAAGSRLGRPLDFSKLRIHMGYVSIF
jgi:outer membrane protein assembly factor BamA